MGILSVMRNVEAVVIVFLIIKEPGGVLVLLHCYCAIKQKFKSTQNQNATLHHF